MKINLSINSEESPGFIEVSITGNKEVYSNLSGELKILKTDTIFLLADKKSDFYKNSIETLYCKIKDNTNELLDLCLDKNSLIISGNKSAYLNLSETLFNLSECEKSTYNINPHFHIDYYEGNGILSETNISLILELVEPF